jgi:hypothetical protein
MSKIENILFKTWEPHQFFNFELLLYPLYILSMVVHTCKKCGESNYLTPHAFWNIADFGAKCEKCETINMINVGKGRT